VKTVRPTSTLWHCTKRSRQCLCKATVLQRNAEFSVGAHQHCHEPEPGVATVAQVRADVVAKTTQNIYASAAVAVDEVFLAHQLDRQVEPLPTLPSQRNLAQTANRRRQHARPQHPQDMEFELDMAHIPDDYLIGDVSVRGKRHLVFATSNQLTLLASSKRWFLDGTFKLVKTPFTQLFGIHSFIRQGDSVKQVPLVFAIMTSRKKRDYAAVMQCVFDNLPDELKVQRVTLDFEAGLWHVLGVMMPWVALRGCAFHWRQCIFRKIQALGLYTSYLHDEATHNYCQLLMALPFLPAEHISAMFSYLENKAATPPLVALTQYIASNWIASTVWPPEVWSVFMEPVRTNNDVEGYHTRINGRAQRGQLQLYLLVHFLHQEARLVTLQMKLVSANKLKRYQRLTYRRLQGKLFKLWEKYIEHEMTPKQLLKATVHFVGM